MDTSTWKWFRYDEIFAIKKGFYNKKPEHIPNGTIPFIGATESNNGVTSLCDIEIIYCCPVKLKTAQFVAPKPSKYGHRCIFL